MDTIALFTNDNILAKVTRVYEFKDVDEQELERIENLLVNPVDSESIKLDYEYQSLEKNTKNNAERNITYDGFINFSDSELDEFLKNKEFSYELGRFKRFFKNTLKVKVEIQTKQNCLLLTLIGQTIADICTFNTGLDIDFEERRPI